MTPTERLVTSRKIWGGLLGSTSIITAGRIISDPAVATQAIIQLGILWGAAVAGQAAYDYVRGKSADNNQQP